MNRLPEQLVAWHNRHPLALRITVNDVHTVGVVALPFMRSGSHGAAALPLPARMIEPVLDDAVSAEPAEPQEPVWGGESVLTPDADVQPLPPVSPVPRWKFWLRAGTRKSGVQQNTWPVFSEVFIDGLSVRSISRFAQACGFVTRPGQAIWPTREVAIDDVLIAPANAASGAWPLELYLISAAIDASAKRRTRVLIGQGTSNDAITVLGRRCLSPLRVGGLGLALLLLVSGGAAALWWPHGEAVHEAASAAPAVPASAASAPSAPSTPSALPDTPGSAPDAALSAVEAASAASAVSMAASGADTAPEPVPAPATAPAPEAEAASEPTRDIRPRLVERAFIPRNKQPTRAMLAPPEPASAPAPAPASKPLEKVAEPKTEKAAVKPMPSGLNKDIEKGQPVVALVGPPSANKADAEALLERLRTAVEGARGKSNSSLQAAVFQTPEGWRAAVWPFASREEAQIINATLVARGLKTRAVDF